MEASKQVDLTLQVEQAARELQSVQEVLATKEAEFVETITAREAARRNCDKLRDTEIKVNILREQQQNQSETHNGEMKHLIEQLEQLRQTAERDCENSKLLRYRALEAERQKWEAREATQLDQAMQQITVLRGQSKVNGIIRSVKCDELEKRESTVSSPLSLTPLDEVFVDKSETASEANAGTLKPTATTTMPKISGNCVASSSLVPIC